MNRTVSAAIGFGIGVLILLLSALSWATSAQWGDLGRDGAQVGYAIVGFFLLVAGIGCLAATWNHAFRVLAPGRKHAGGHH